MTPARPETPWEKAQREFLMARTHHARRKAWKTMERIRAEEKRPQ